MKTTAPITNRTASTSRTVDVRPDIRVRAVEDGDHDAVHGILTSRHILGGTMRVPHAARRETVARLQPASGTHHLVALVGDEVVGFAELVTYPDAPRHRHVGELNLIATAEAWGGRGVGRALLDEVIDLADNWLGLNRLGLTAFTDNTHAIRLYERVGFVIEGTMARYGFGNGAWMDAHLMGRLRPEA
ncbi:MAG: GNAT family N-acetyltransferase [Actinomycetota bacterium]|nr:GNAT family N-acetyltransferase [Actinomycetota bacterium]